MHVAFDFQPADGPAQTLYCDMNPEQMSRVTGITTGPDAENTFLTLCASTSPEGLPIRGMVFRADRITDLRKAR